MTTIMHSIVPLDQPVIQVFTDDDNDFYCNEFGKIDSWHSALHSGHIRGNGSRMCVHRTVPMQRTTVLGADWVAGLHWWATLVDGKHPVIASRNGNLVSLMFDALGPIRRDTRDELRCMGVGHQRPLHKFVYKLHRVQFAGDENPDDRIYLGAWPE